MATADLAAGADVLFPIPNATDYVLRPGDRGVAVWSLQRLCNKLGIPTKEDGDFAKSTELSARAAQIMHGVKVVDGIIGPVSQGAFADRACARQEERSKLPKNIIRGKVKYESGDALGAVNWSAAGGVDCCWTQRRVYAFQYDDADAIMDAFDAVYQLQLSADAHKLNYARFWSLGKIRKTETCHRVCVLSHNYPALALEVAKHGFKGLSSYWTSPQSWTLQHDPNTGKAYRLKFPDGKEIFTPLEWGQRYALGNPDHDEPGQAVKLVQWV